MILITLVWFLHGLIPLLVLGAYLIGPSPYISRAHPFIVLGLIAVLAFMGHWMTAFMALGFGYGINMVHFAFHIVLDLSSDVYRHSDIPGKNVRKWIQGSKKHGKGSSGDA